MTTDRREDLERAGLWPEVGLPMPNADAAVISPLKLHGYALSATHGRGRHKAIVFRSALGFDSDDWELLRDQILDQLPVHPVYVARERGEDPTWGVRLPITGTSNQVVDVITSWKMLGRRPQLVSCRVA